MSKVAVTDGADIPHSTTLEICKMLGYDPYDVRNIILEGSRNVTVEVFLRMPDPSTERGRKVLSADRDGYAFVAVTHPISFGKKREDAR